MISPELLSTLSTSTVLSLSEVPLLPVWEHVEIPRTFTPRRFQFSSDHEFFEDGDVHRHLYLEDVLTGIGEVEERSNNPCCGSDFDNFMQLELYPISAFSGDRLHGRVSEFPCQAAGCSQVFDTLESYEHHYNTLHRNVCSTCKRSFPSARLLDIHILEWHDSLFLIMAEKSNMFQCLVEGCVEKFKTCGERKNHLIKTHLYPSDFRFDKPRKSKTSKIREGIAGLSMDVTTENSIVVESMEISELPSGDCGALRQSTTSTTYAKSRVPSTICFGHGSVRGFKHTKKKK